MEWLHSSWQVINLMKGTENFSLKTFFFLSLIILKISLWFYVIQLHQFIFEIILNVFQLTLTFHIFFSLAIFSYSSNFFKFLKLLLFIALKSLIGTRPTAPWYENEVIFNHRMLDVFIERSLRRKQNKKSAERSKEEKKKPRRAPKRAFYFALNCFVVTC